MRSAEIQNLIDAVEAAYGPVTLYGSNPSQEHGTCFKITGTPATFSVLTLDGTLPLGNYDIQIEGVPPGDYIYTAQVSLGKFIELVSRFARPKDEWPLVRE